MSEEQKGVEISNPTLGSIRVFGMDPNMLFTVLGFVAACIAGSFLWTHMAEAGKNDAAIIASNKEVATALKESNKEVAAALKDAQKETASILREMARATREQNCLLAIDQTKRAQMVDFCKRLAQ